MYMYQRIYVFQCLLAQGFWTKSSWGFPKGKVNEEEAPHNCAVREVRRIVIFCRFFLELRNTGSKKLCTVKHFPK